MSKVVEFKFDVGDEVIDKKSGFRGIITSACYNEEYNNYWVENDENERWIKESNLTKK